jgi:hypothetical protein
VRCQAGQGVRPPQLLLQLWHVFLPQGLSPSYFSLHFLHSRFLTTNHFQTAEVLKIKCRSFANDIEKILKKCEDNEGYSSGRLIHDKHVVEAHVASC